MDPDSLDLDNVLDNEYNATEEQEEPFIPHRIFVNNIDEFNTSVICSTLADKFYGEQEEEEVGEEGGGEEEEEMLGEEIKMIKPVIEKVKYQIVGTAKTPQIYKQTEDIYKIIQEDDTFQDEILKCGVIIYDITSNPMEIQKALATLQIIENYLQAKKEEAPKKYEKSTESRIFILISTIMTWAHTKPVDPDDPDVAFTDADFKKRRPHENYKEHCVLEKEVIEKGKKYKGKLFTIVIASGITYGKQENDLHLLFKQAWHNSLELPIISSGKNTIPLIHIVDLANVISAILTQVPKKPKYILAVEQTTCTQKRIVNAISKTLGSGKTKMLSLSDAYLWSEVTQWYFDKMTVNLKMEPGYIVEELGITFQSDLNFVENIEKVVREFKESRNLHPVKILMHGPPAVGKTTIAKALAKIYDVHYINVASLIEESIAQLTADIEYARQKLKESEEKEENAKDADDEDEEEEEDDEAEDPQEMIDEMTQRLKEVRSAIEDSENGRLPDETIIEFLRTKLSSNPCKNQGYILDGYPKTEEQTKELFNLADLLEAGGEEAEGEEEEEEGEVKVNIMPQYVIGLEADDEFLCMRLMRKPEREIQGTHYTEERMAERLSEFHRNNTEDNTLLNIFDFLEIHPLMIKADTDIQERIIKIITDKIGAKKGYPTSLEETVLRLRREHDEKAEQQRIEDEKQMKLEEELSKERKKTMENWLDLTQKIQEEEEQILLAQSKPLREYIMKYIFPTLTKGLVEVARIKPDDPIDYLAEYLFRENPEGHMFDPTYVKEAEELLETIKEYQHQVSKFLDIEQ